MNKDSELFIKMKTMNKEELAEYLHISVMTGRVCSVLGIGSIFLALVFTNAFTIPVAIIIVYVASQIGAGVDELGDYIRSMINS